MCGNCARLTAGHQPAQAHRHRPIRTPQRAPRMGSVRIVNPSIFSSTVLCPSQAACSPVSDQRLGCGVKGAGAPRITFLAIPLEIFRCRLSRISRRSRPLSQSCVASRSASQYITSQNVLPSTDRHACVPVPLPKSSFVAIQQLQARDPLRALPGVQLRYDQPRRPAMLFRQRLAIVQKRHQRVSARKSARGRLVLNPAS